VTTGAIAAHLKLLGVFTSVGVGAVLPARHLVLDAEWGYKDRSNKVMPGPGRTSERDYMPTEVAEHRSRANELGVSLEVLLKVLGTRTVDVFLNTDAYWTNVPANVWGFAVTRNRALKKWLSYRESSILGRALTPDEVRQFAVSVRRIAALLLMNGDLNENLYRVLSVQNYRPGTSRLEL
jgi:hypothetical protein